MTLSMYQASAPVFIRTLEAMKRILEKAAAHAEARKIDPSALITARLYPDMLPLARQVQIASDFARATCARLAGAEPLAFEDKETTFPELIDRIDRTVAYVKTFDAARIDGSEEREIVRPLRGQPHRFTGQGFLMQFALPNFFFHATTMYDILRHNGLEIGKADFIGSID